MNDRNNYEIIVISFTGMSPDQIDQTSTPLSSRDVARLLKCAPDYVSRLCRDGKLRGWQRDGLWVVDPSSIAEFQSARARAKEARKHELADLRRTENRLYQREHATGVTRLWHAVRSLPLMTNVTLTLGALLLLVALVFASTLIASQYSPRLGVRGGSISASISQAQSLFFGAGAPNATVLDGSVRAFSGATHLLSNAFSLLFGRQIKVTQEPSQNSLTSPLQSASASASTTVVAASVSASDRSAFAPAIVNNVPVVDRIIERDVAVGGVTQEQLTTRLEDLYNRLSVQISLLQNPGHESPLQNVVVSQVINNLSNVRLSGDTVANNITADYMNAGRLDVSGNANVGGIFSAATTTLSNLTVSGDTTIFGNLSLSGLNQGTFNAGTSTLTNLTVSNLSTSTFAGRLSVAGLSTLAGFFSTASSTVGDGTQSGGLTINGGATTTGNAYFAGGLGIGVATSAPGVLQVASNAYFGGDLFVGGNSTVVGNGSSNTLTINSSINSSITPNQNITHDLGSPAFFWRNVYVGNIVANNISAASTTIAGTASATFTINSDNVSSDGEDMDLIFFRGNVVPNALFSWKSIPKRFELNQALFIANQSGSLTTPTLRLQGIAGQTGNLLELASSSGATIFSVDANGATLGNGFVSQASSTVVGSLTVTGNTSLGGAIGIGTTSPAWALQVAGTRPSFALTDTSASANLKHWVFSSMGGNLYISTSSDALATSTMPAITIDPSGRVGIGTTSPSNALDVSGFAQLSGGLTVNRNDGGVAAFIQQLGSSGDIIRFLSGGTSNSNIKAVITNSGSLGIGTTTPFANLSVQGNSYTSGSAFFGGAITATSSLTVSGQTTLGSASTTNLSASGSVLVGTTDSSTEIVYSSLLKISGTRPALYLNDAGEKNFSIYSDANSLNFRDATAGIVRAAIDTNGSLGIGTTSPFARLSITGTDTSNTTRGFVFADSANAPKVTITNGGNLVIGTTTLTSATVPLQISENVGGGILARFCREDGSFFCTFFGTGNSAFAQTNTGGGFFTWFNGGTYSNGIFSGGTQDMALRGGTLIIGTSTNNSGSGGHLQIWGKRGFADYLQVTNADGGTASPVGDVFKIDGGGRVGLATTTPWRTLSVAGTSDLGTNALAGSFTATTTLGTATSTIAHVLTVAGGTPSATIAPLFAVGTTNVPNFYVDQTYGTAVAQSGSNATGGGYLFRAYSTINSNSYNAYYQANDANGPRFAFNKFRGTGNEIAAGDDIGVIDFLGVSSAGTTVRTALILGEADTGWGGAGDSPGRLSFWTTPDGSGTALERIRITSEGNVGIGTTTPSKPLSVQGDALVSGTLTAGSLVATSTFTSSGLSTFLSGISSLASSTIGNGTQAGGLTVNGGATTTRNLAVLGGVKIGTGATPLDSAHILSVGNATDATFFNVGQSSARNFEFGWMYDAVPENAYGQIVTYGYGNDFKIDVQNLLLQTASGGKVGIGSTTPFAKLSVKGVGTGTGANFQTTNSFNNPLFTILDNGNVGIGTTAPPVTLSVAAAQRQLALLDSNAASDSNTTNGSFLSAEGGKLLFGGMDSVGNAVFRGAFNWATGTFAVGTTSPSFNIESRSNSGTILPNITGAANAAFNTNTTDNTYASMNFGTLDTVGASVVSSLIAGVNTSHTPSAVSGDLAFLTRNAGALAERMRLTAAGNLGIGTTSPTATLHVFASGATDANNVFTGSQLQLSRQADGAGLGFRMKGNNAGISGQTFPAQIFTSSAEANALELYTIGAIPMVFGAGGSERMRITGAGNVGIGTTSPQSLLAISGGVSIGADYNTAAPANGLIVEGNTIFGSTANTGGGKVQIALGTPNTGNAPTSIAAANSYLQIGGNEFGTNSYRTIGFGYNSSGRVAPAYIGYQEISASSDTMGDLIFGTRSVTTANTVPTERLRITTTGLAGFGTTTPWAQLSASSTASNPALAIQQNGAGAAAIFQGGNVGIGTTTPQTVLTVSGGSAISGGSNLGTANFGSSGSSAGVNLGTYVGGYGAIQGTAAYGNTAASVLINPNGGAVGIGAIGALGSPAGNAFSSGVSIGSSYWSTAKPTNGLIVQGNIGIGTTTPTRVFESYSGVASIAARFTSGQSNVDIQLSSNGTFSTADSGYIRYSDSRALSFFTANTQRLTVDSSGNVGVGTSSPWRTLSVSGTVGLSGLTGATGAGSLCLDANNEVVYNSGSDSCLSSTRATKHDIVALSVSGLDLLSALQPVSFVYNNDASSTVRYGFIAEDAAAVDQHLATYDAYGAISGIDDRSIIAVVVKALKELTSQVRALADAVAGLAIVVTTKHVQADDIQTDKLCVGTTCVTEAQLKLLLQGASESGTPGGAGGGATSTPTDTIPPSIVLIGNDPAQLHVGDMYSDPGVTISDVGSPNIGYVMSLDGGATTTPDQFHLDTSTSTIHIILYSATDQAGNTGTATRTVIVEQ